MGIFGSSKKKNTQKGSQTGSKGLNRQQEDQAVKEFSSGLIDVQDIIAPSAIEIDFNQMLVGSKYFRTYFVTGYPRFVGSNWLSPLINFDHPVDISTFYYPVDTGKVMERLKRKIGEFEATINIALDEGKIPDPSVKVALSDANELQEQLASGTEKYFHFALYVTIRADDLKSLEKISRNIESTLASVGVVIKTATLQQEQGFRTSMPIGNDEIYVTRNMDTTSLATTFPFVSSELTMEDGILYGLNKHNNSLIIFDRFKLANANMVVFATSGAGKSYFVKLEAMRSLMFGTEIIIIDPEREYEKLCTAIGGDYISFSQDGAQKLNPFELSGIYQKDEDELRFKILSLNGLFKIMLGGNLTPEESAILDRAIILTYKEKGITPDPATQRRPAPLLSDLYKILQAMAEPDAHKMAGRLERYVKGSAAGIFDQPSNIEIKNTFTVFSIRDLSEDLRPIAMYMMLDYIWTRIKRERRKRLLVIDEAWWLMRYPDAAKFLHSISKRARKYALGVTTITQDVEDFLDNDYGKAVVTNSALQVLLKQSPAAVDRIQKVFYLTSGEKNYLLSAGIGEGLFFAGSNHVATQVIASENEHNLITTNPIEMMQKEQQAKEAEQAQAAKLAKAEQTQKQAQVPAAQSPQPSQPSQPAQQSQQLQQSASSNQVPRL
ncbi:ATP-binding protein [Candidatus Dojkabacteria bacterium]|nr:ATP-binding protein [Candidatus Dojkabacteria bacterium]